MGSTRPTAPHVNWQVIVIAIWYKFANLPKAYLGDLAIAAGIRFIGLTSLDAGRVDTTFMASDTTSILTQGTPLAIRADLRALLLLISP